LIIITRFDWKREGLAAGSKMTEDAWKDWKRPAMSRERAKLFLNRTFEKFYVSHIPENAG
jgi:hypothetical protein